MKSLLLFLTPLFLLIMGCSSSENTVSKENIQIINAEYKQWSKPPAGNSDVPERGTDLSVTISSWPSDFIPTHIIYNNRKSLSATITDTVDGNVVITGRIIRSSSKLAETSESVMMNDRLVFSDSDGNTSYVPIENWERNQ